MTKKQSENGPVSLSVDWVIPGAGVLFGIYYLYSIKDLPWEAQMLGLFLSLVVFLLAALLALRSIHQARTRGARFGFEILGGNRQLLLQRLGLLALCVAYVLLVDVLGFTLITFLFLLAAMLHLGVRSTKVLILLPTILAAAGYVLFIVVLNSRLPHGIVENLLNPIVGTVF